MADQQRKIKPELKRRLMTDAGNKCANPGCTNSRVHIHHIKHWAVYKCHDAAEMIAICPSCHDAAHHGNLKISDEMLYLWKGIERNPISDTAQIFVEPAEHLKLLTGTTFISTDNDQLTIIDFPNGNYLRIQVLDGDLLQVSLRLNNHCGKQILRVVANHVRVARDSRVQFEHRAGRVRVFMPATPEFIQPWLLGQMRYSEPDYAADGQVIALDLEVMKPGLLRIQGCWSFEKSALVITRDATCFCREGMRQAVRLKGNGVSSGIFRTGPSTDPCFTV